MDGQIKDKVKPIKIQDRKSLLTSVDFNLDFVVIQAQGKAELPTIYQPTSPRSPKLLLLTS